MGREYFGDIQGKFWNGVQPSNDASYFKPPQADQDIYLVCGCSYRLGQSYCEFCYETREEHWEAIREENYEDFDENEDYTEADTNISYYFEEDDKEIVEEKLDELFSIMTYRYDFDFDNFTFEIDKSGYKVDWMQIVKLNEKVLHLVARYCLGKQILECINRLGECTFECQI